MTIPKKMGRPTINPRNYDLHIRLSAEERELITEGAKKTGLTKTELIVKGVKLVMEQLNR